jgi:HEPN domain-containing protein
MPDQQFEPDDPREWLQRAQSNLIRARQQAPGVYLEDLCFDAQQAAEKSIKALLLHMDVPFPHTHDLADLITLVQRNGLSVPEEIKAATALSEYAVGWWLNAK